MIARRHFKELLNFVRRGEVEKTDEGLLVHRSIIAYGKYYTRINEEDEQVSPNLLPSQGLDYIIGVALGATAKLSNWYIALYSGNVTPAANWTAANFNSNATEITSLTEGFSNVTRPAWTPSSVTSGKINNLSSRAVFNVVCSTTLNIAGAALLSDQTRGGVSGVLLSADRYPSVRVVNNTDTFDVGYEVGLTDS